MSYNQKEANQLEELVVDTLVIINMTFLFNFLMQLSNVQDTCQNDYICIQPMRLHQKEYYHNHPLAFWILQQQ